MSYHWEEPESELVSHYIIKNDEELANMKEGKNISQFKAEFIDGIGYYEYHWKEGERFSSMLNSLRTKSN
jgi:hypothetical protein